MAFSYVKENAVGSVDLGDAGTDTANYAIPITSAPGAGKAVVLFFDARDDNGTLPVPTVTDSKGNTYTVKAKSVTVSTARTWCLVAVTDQSAGTLTTSDTITVHTGTAAKWEAVLWWVEEFSFPAGTTLFLDVFATNSGSGTSMPTGTTAATAVAAELALANCATSYQLTTKDAAYTQPTSGAHRIPSNTLTGAFGVGGNPSYKILSATGTQAATYTGTSASFAGVIVVLKALTLVSLTLAGTSSLSATVTPYQRFSASLVGSSSLAATLTPYQRMTLSLGGTSALIATLTPYQRMILALAGSSSLGATLTPYQRIALALAGTSSLDATVTPYQRMLLTLAGSSSLTAEITPYQEIVLLLQGSSSLSASLTPYQRFTALLAGGSSLDATLTPYQRILLDLAGRSSLDATLTPYQRFVASLAGTSSLDATLTPYQQIQAVLAGTSTLAADIGFLRQFAVVLAGSSSLEATIKEYQRIVALLEGTSALAATITNEGMLVDLAGRSSLAATLTAYHLILAVLAGSSSISAGVVVPPRPGFVIGGIVGNFVISEVVQDAIAAGEIVQVASAEALDKPAGTLPHV